MAKNKYDVFKAIADPTRRKIIGLLFASGSLSITAIAGDFAWSRQVVTKHIYALEKAGLITFRDAGRERYCQPDYRPLKTVFDWVSYYDKFWDAKLNRLSAHLKGKQTKFLKK